MEDDIDPSELGRLWGLPYSVETETKIARLLSGDSKARSSEEQFETAVTVLTDIYFKVKDKAKPQAQSLATQIIRRICIIAMSTNDLFRGHEADRLPILDSTSIAILSRALIEASIMYWYLMEDVSEDEWMFRLQVMKIHDSAARVRFLKGLLFEEDADKERATLADLRAGLKVMPGFMEKDEKVRVRLRAGELVYVNGMRSVVKQIGIPENYYDGLYNYLSAQVHSTPISYSRDRQDDSVEQIIWQRGFSQYSLWHSAQMMARVALREIELHSLQQDYDTELLDRLRRLVGTAPPAPA